MRFLQNNKKDDGTLFGTGEKKKEKKKTDLFLVVFWGFCRKIRLCHFSTLKTP